MDQQILRALIPSADSNTRSSIGEVLERFGAPILSLCADARVTIHVLVEGERFDDASPALKRLGVDVDAWPAPPAGLFVVEERAVYLRSVSPMTIAHEFGHALDCALGNGVYFSGINAAVRQAFARAKSFVTPYAATGVDEYFAECIRAYVGVNDAASLWPSVSRASLERIDAVMYQIIGALFRGRVAGL